MERGTVEPAPTYASRRSDLDGDGGREVIQLMRGPRQRLLFDDVEVDLPATYVQDWRELFVVDLDPSDGLREVALLKRIDERHLMTDDDGFQLLVVAYVDGEAHFDRPALLYGMRDMIENRAVLNGEIKASSSNCLVTTSIHHIYGPKAKLIQRQVTFEPSERDDPACGDPDVWITREADLDGDGVDEEIMLQGRRLFVGSDVVEVPYPGQQKFADIWGGLRIVDLDPSDDRREVLVARFAGEEHLEVMIVAYLDGQAHSSGVLDLYTSYPDLEEGAVLDNEIVTAGGNCDLTSETVYVFGPLAQVVEKTTTTTGTYNPDRCFG